MRRAALWLLVASCTRPGASTGAGAGGAPEGAAAMETGGTGGESGAASGTGGAPATPPPPAPVPLDVHALGPAGESVTLAAGSLNSIPPGSTFLLESPQALTDFRVRLLDQDDRLVPSHDTARVGQGTTYRLVPEDPLPPGTSFRLEAAGQLGEGPTAAGGVHFESLNFALKTTGEKPPPPPQPSRRRKRHH